MAMQQSGSWSQPEPSTQPGLRDQFNDGQNDDETYNDEDDC